MGLQAMMTGKPQAFWDSSFVHLVTTYSHCQLILTQYCIGKFRIAADM